jgi:HlyD family secretion protein
MNSNRRLTPRMKSTAIATAIAALLAGAVILTSISASADDKKAAAASPKPALTVTTAKAQSSDLAVKLAANGNVAAWQEMIIGAEVNGLRLGDVRVNVGDVVKKGQVLATFVPQTVQADLAQMRANVAEAEAALAEAQANADRAKTLEASGALSTQQINQYTTAAKTAAARLEASKAMLNSAGIRLGNTRVLAPDNGVISQRVATVGGVMQAGQEMFRMIRNNRLEWRAEVTATDLDKLAVGQSVTLATPAGAAVTGKVRMVAPTIDPQSRSTIVYVDLPQGSAARAGMFVKGEFELGKTAGLTVPQQSVVVRDGFNYVFALAQGGAQSGAQSRVVQQKISVGRRIGDRVEILDGLKAEQTIVAAGAGFLNDGDLVAIGAAPTRAAAAPTGQAATMKSPQTAGSSESKAAKTPAK